MSINKNFICLIEGYRNTMNDIPLLMEEYDSILRQTLESAQTRILKKKKKDFTKFS